MRTLRRRTKWRARWLPCWICQERRAHSSRPLRRSVCRQAAADRPDACLGCVCVCVYGAGQCPLWVSFARHGAACGSLRRCCRFVASGFCCAQAVGAWRCLRWCSTHPFPASPVNNGIAKLACRCCGGAGSTDVAVVCLGSGAASAGSLADACKCAVSGDVWRGWVGGWVAGCVGEVECGGDQC